MNLLLSLERLSLLSLALSAGFLISCRTPGTQNELTSTSTQAAVAVAPLATDGNVMTVTVGAPGFCSATPNILCTTVTICLTGTTTCQTIDQIHVDTGSSGLRLFRSLLPFSPKLLDTGSGILADCVSFGDGSNLWGPLAVVDLKMGNEPTIAVPIHLLDASFAKAPPSCSSAANSPEDFGMNGILGVSLLAEDCGPLCRNPAYPKYFDCNGTTCSPSSSPLSLPNPVTALPVDHNGLILQLPAVASSGALSAQGFLVFGIGTQANNQTGNIIALPAFSNKGTAASIRAVAPGSSTVYPAWFDSGTSLGYVPSTLPLCTSADFNNLYCPTTHQTLNVTLSGVSGTASTIISVGVDNAEALASGAGANFLAFSNLVGPPPASIAGNYDLGLSFFFGRKLYFGIEGQTSPLGVGPYYGL